MVGTTCTSINSFGEEYRKRKEKLPYHINLIDQLHASENAHTRILLEFLKLPKDKGWIYKSFLKYVVNEPKGPFNKIEKLPEIKFNENNIDGMIMEQGEYAIIIENKIHWANDQNEQIKRYVEIIQKKLPGKKQNIYVLYLTFNGAKEVSEYSLTSEAKEMLGCTNDSKGRFIPINYRDDILPWLQNEILPNCRIREDWLISALAQYIDHLKGLLNLRDDDRKIADEMKKCITANLVQEWQECPIDVKESENYKILGRLISELCRTVEDIFYGELLPESLKESGLVLEPGWNPNISSRKWAAIKPQLREKIALNFEGPLLGIPYRLKDEDTCKPAVDEYWKTMKIDGTKLHRNWGYELGYMKLKNTLQCDSQQLISILNERNTHRYSSFEQSSILKEKAEKLKAEILKFKNAACQSLKNAGY